MSINIRVPPEKTWSFFMDNRQKLHQKMLLLASNTEIDGSTKSIYMSEEDGLPQFVVFEDDEPVCMTEVCNANRCRLEAEDLYNQYIYELIGDDDPDDILDQFGAVIDEYIASGDDEDEDPVAPDEDEEEIENQRIITENEDNLDQAFGVLLEAIAEEAYYKRPDADKICDDIKELICEYLYRKYDVSVYRPMYLEDGDGKEFFVDHPYEHMIFEDPNNPLYKK